MPVSTLLYDAIRYTAEQYNTHCPSSSSWNQRHQYHLTPHPSPLSLPPPSLLSFSTSLLPPPFSLPPYRLISSAAKSGKSTLIKLLVQETEPDEGTGGEVSESYLSIL